MEETDLKVSACDVDSGSWHSRVTGEFYAIADRHEHS